MSDLPSMPLFVDVFEAATSHLTLEEDGAYNRLLRLCWRTSGCTIPNDPSWIAKRLRLSADDFERVVRPLIDEFFTVENGRLFQKRQRKEFEYVTNIIAVRKEAGSMGGKARALKYNDLVGGKPTIELEAKSSKPQAPTLTPTPTQDSQSGSSQTDIFNQADNSVGAVSPKRAPNDRGSSLPADWVLPRGWGEWALSEYPAIGREGVLSIAAEFKDYWIGVPGQRGRKKDWEATWRNSVRMKASRSAPRAGPAPNGKVTPSEAFSKLKDFYNAQAEREGDDSGSTGTAVQDVPKLAHHRT